MKNNNKKIIEGYGSITILNTYSFTATVVLLDSSLTVKAAPYEYVIRTSQPEV